MTSIVYFSACAIVFALQCSSSLSAAETGFFQSKPPSCAAKFELTDVNGQRHTLADLRGQPAVVHFFATWCEPCKIEFASLRAFAERRSGQVRVLAINVGEVPGRVRRFLQETPVSFPVVLDADRAVANPGVSKACRAPSFWTTR